MRFNTITVISASVALCLRFIASSICTVEDDLKPPVACYPPFQGGDFCVIQTKCYLE